MKRRFSQPLPKAFLAVLLTASATAFATPASAAPKPTKPAVSVTAAPSPTPGVAPTPTVLTYQAWKNLRIDEARLVLERVIFENQLEKQTVIERAPGEKQAVVRPVGVSVTPSPVPGVLPAPTPSRVAVRADSRADSRIEQARMALETAQDLTVNDYLVIYLSQFKSRDVISDVARRMSPEEVTELLTASQKLSSPRLQ